MPKKNYNINMQEMSEIQQQKLLQKTKQKIMSK